MTHALYLRTQFGRLTSVSDPDASYAYRYDAAGRLTSVDNAGTPGVPHVVLTYGYDAVNNRVSLTDSLGPASSTPTTSAAG